MILDAAPWRERAGLRCLTQALGDGAGEVRFVGGAVRDTLLGLPVSDLDLATVHPPEEVMRRVGAAGMKLVPTGLAHGTVTVVLADGPVEVTTLRRDVATDGRHAEVAFTADWEADAARRDFTINALSAEPRSGEIHDYFGGLEDLAARRVRFIGDPLMRIAEDHLRILRFFRFHARFGLEQPDDAGLASCRARAADLMALSRERIAQEMLKLLAVADPVPTVSCMVDNAILTPVLPEIAAAGLPVLARLIARDDGDPIRRLAALLPPDLPVVDDVARRLRLSTAQRRRLVLACDPRSLPDVRAAAYRDGVEAVRDRLLLWSDDATLDAGRAMLDGWQPPRMPLTGGKLIALGLTPGPAVAATLGQVERQWVDAGFPDTAWVEDAARAVVAQTLRERK